MTWHIVQLEHPVLERLHSDLQYQLAYCDPIISSFDLSALNRGEIRYQVPDGVDHENIERKIRWIAQQITTNARRTKEEVIFDQRHLSVPNSSDIDEEMVARGWVKQLGPGQYMFAGPYLALMEYFDSQFLDLARNLDAVPQRYPALVSTDFLRRLNYFSSFPYYITYALHLCEDIEIIRRFVSRTQANEGKPSFEAIDELSPPEFILGPAACYNVYYTLQDQTIPTPGLVLTMLGRVFRYEAGNLHGLQRLWEFAMRELVFIGSLDHVKWGRQQCIEWTQDFARRLGLRCWIENANDPFFVDGFHTKTQFQLNYSLKYELRVSLPQHDTSLACASFNLHANTFGTAANIRLPDGTTAFTGCTGFGLERFVYAFLSQFGLDPRNWSGSIAQKSGVL